MRFKVNLFLIGLASIVLVGCEWHGGSHKTYPPAAEFGGVIRVVISEPRGQRFSNYTFEARPSEGRSDLVKEEVVESADLHVGGNSTGHINCSASPQLPSPDGKLIARCEGPPPGPLSLGEHDFVIFEDSVGRQIRKNGIWNELRVMGFAWSPDSKNVAVLCASTTWSWRPLDILARGVGSGVPDFDYNLELFSAENDRVALHVPYMRANSRYGSGAITSWSEK